MSKHSHLYKTSRWFRLRGHQLKHHPLCAFCEKKGRIEPARVADHKVRHNGDEALFYDAENLQSLCKQCHDSTKQTLERSGTLLGCDVSGVPDDPNHHWR